MAFDIYGPNRFKIGDRLTRTQLNDLRKREFIEHRWYSIQSFLVFRSGDPKLAMKLRNFYRNGCSVREFQMKWLIELCQCLFVEGYDRLDVTRDELKEILSRYMKVD